jgi:CHAT domain-containing protein/tetratricopeptide (TPR) repeat protein
MPRKLHLLLWDFQLRLKSLRFSSRQFVHRGWHTYPLLVFLTVLLCILNQPVFAHLSSGISATQNRLTASQLVQQGREHYESEQFATAAKVWQQAAQAYQSQGDRLNQAMVLSNLALTARELGHWTEATEAISSSLELLQSEPDSPQRYRILAQALNTKGSLQMAQGQAQQAISTLQQEADVYKRVGDEVGVIRNLINQAQVLRVLGLYRRAVATLTEVNQSLERQPDSSLKAVGLRHLGNALRLVGELNKSRAVLQQSLVIAEKLSLPQDVGAALLALGNTLRAKLETETAIAFYQKAAAVASLPTTRIQALVNELSLITERGAKGDLLALTQPLLSQIQTQLADLPLGRIAVYARINFAQSLIKLETGNPPLPKLREVAQILATAVQQAESLGDRQAQSYALGSLGGLYEKTQQWSEARSLTQEALVLAQAFNAPDIAYRWQWQLGRLLKTQGDEKGAIAAYTEAVNTLQSLRSELVAVNSEVQFSFREGVEPVYREFVSLLLNADGITTSPERLEQARKVIEFLQVAELDNFFRAACLTAKPVKIDTIDPKAAVIYPIVLADRLEVILSLPQQPLRHYATSLSQDQVERTVEQLRLDLIQPFSQRILPYSRQVYNWLIQPAEADLARSKVKTLVFVLDGSLRNIPMAALHDGKQFLIEKYDIALAPGLELLEPQPLARRQIGALKAGLSEARQGFPALPYVQVELNQIQSLVPGKVLLDRNFTKTSILNAIDAVPVPIVHLATHGQFSSKAEETFILTWDDRINVNELNNLLQKTDLRRSSPIELLVLSACETAKGDRRAALGLAGMAVRAGARSTLATLWLVDDEVTAALMSRFYQELANYTVTKAQALRRAQLSILQNPKYEKQPYYWAAYVLVGNWL